MYALAWDSPAGMYGYGPFEDGDAASKWFNGRQAFFDPAKHQIVGYLLLTPFESKEPVSDSVGSLYHQGRDADDRAPAFMATVVVSSGVAFGVGPFPSRVDAESWFLSQRMHLGGADGLILPLLPLS